MSKSVSLLILLVLTRCGGGGGRLRGGRETKGMGGDPSQYLHHFDIKGIRSKSITFYLSWSHLQLMRGVPAWGGGEGAVG